MQHARSIEEHTGHTVPHPPISTPFVTSFSSGLPPGRPISCYTYGVPCVASPDLVAYCRGLVTSTIHNYDIVPTLSLGVLRDFKSMAMGFYAEQGVCEEIVGRVIGLCQKRFMARRAAKKAETPRPGSPHDLSSPPDADDCDTPESLTDPSDESRLVPLTDAELTAGRGANKALEPAYRDPSLLGTDLVAGDSELSDWLWSLRTTIRAGSDSEKLYPPGAFEMALALPALAEASMRLQATSTSSKTTPSSSPATRRPPASTPAARVAVSSSAPSTMSSADSPSPSSAVPVR